MKIGINPKKKFVLHPDCTGNGFSSSKLIEALILSLKCKRAKRIRRKEQQFRDLFRGQQYFATFVFQN